MSDAKTTRELCLSIPHTHRCFADHFPGAPLVPGALLLKWIMALLADQLRADQPGRIHYLKQVKFLAPVLPGDELLLSVTSTASAQQLSVAAHVGETLVLKGQFECIYD
jgi:3-hydroxyacyl-[acyl-carrier-protein] dehydratase